MQAPSIFEANNARDSSPEQVAETFIPPRVFSSLCKSKDALIVGPRGSGKTTLLKMLQPSALYSWDSPAAISIAESLEFAGVYIQADVIFAQELAFYADKLSPDGDLVRKGEVFQVARYTTHTLSAFIKTLSALTFRRANDGGASSGSSLLDTRHVALRRLMQNLEARQEMEFAKLIARQWQLEPITFSLAGVRTELAGRLHKIRNCYMDTSISTMDQAYRVCPFLTLDLLDALRSAVTCLEAATDRPQSIRWGLLFDEVEVIPHSLQEKIFGYFRGGHDGFVVKAAMFSTTPTRKMLTQVTSPKNPHDFDQIDLWYSNKEDAFDFCGELFKQFVVRQRHCPPNWRELPSWEVAERVLGSSPFDEGRRRQARSRNGVYRSGSPNVVRLQTLYENDPSFREYIDKHKVDLRSLHKMPDARRAATIRKLTSLVIVREAFLGQQRRGKNGKPIRRSRKNPLIYTGATALFSISEGNPRMLLGLSEEIVQAWNPREGQVARYKQAAHIARVATLFQGVLSNYIAESIDEQPSTSGTREMANLIEIIGRFFEENVVGTKFNGDPVLSFFVDSRLPQQYKDAVRKALEAGAIVHLPHNEHVTILGPVDGHRFRLSYLFAPKYRLPLINGKPRTLSEIIGRSQKLRPRLQQWELTFSGEE